MELHSIKFVTTCYLFLFLSCLEASLSPELEIQRKKKLAEKYLLSVADNDRKDWLDPTDILNFQELNNEEIETPKSSLAKSTYSNAKLLDDSSTITPSSDEKHSLCEKSTKNNKIPNKVSDDEEQNMEMKNLAAEIKASASSLNDIYLSRWLKILLNKVEISCKEDNAEMSYIQFPFDKQFAKLLKEVIETQPYDLQKFYAGIDHAVSNSIIVKNKHIISETLNFSFFYLHYDAIMVAVVLIVMLLLFCFVVRCPKLSLFGLVICVCVFWHWMHLYQEKVAEQHYQLESIEYESACNQRNSGVFHQIGTYVKSFFMGRTDCNKYYKVTLVDPIWKVSLSTAASEALASCVFQPLKVAARVANYCLREFFSELSFLHLAFVGGFTSFALILLCNYRIRLPWFFAVLEPANRYNRILDVPDILTNPPAFLDCRKSKPVSNEKSSEKELTIEKIPPEQQTEKSVSDLETTCCCASVKNVIGNEVKEEPCGVNQPNRSSTCEMFSRIENISEKSDMPINDESL